MGNKSKRWMACAMLMVVLCGLMAGGAMAAETQTPADDAVSGATPPAESAERGGRNGGQGRQDMPRNGQNPGGTEGANRPEKRDMGLLGQIVSVGEDAIVLHMAERPQRPAGTGDAQPSQGEPPAEQPQAEQPQAEVQTMSATLEAGDGAAQDGAAQGETAQGETAQDRRPGKQLTFAAEETTYPLAQGVTVRTGRGQEAAQGSLGDLAAGDVVHLTLNEAGEVTALVKVSGT